LGRNRASDQLLYQKLVSKKIVEIILPDIFFDWVTLNLCLKFRTSSKLMLRLHMQVWQLGAKRKACT